MMKKGTKLVSVFLIVLMLISVMSVPAVFATDELVTNGSFETVSDKVEGWALSVGSMGKEFSIDTKTVHSGKNSFKMKSDAAVRISQSMTGMVAGTEYELSAWVKIVSVGTKGIGTKMEFKNAANEYLKIGTDSTYFTQTTKDWEKITFKFTAPEDVSKAVVYLRVWDSAEVYWDDVSITATSASKPSTSVETEKDEYDPSKDLVTNGSFETVSDKVEGWALSVGSMGEEFSIDTKTVHSGKNSFKMKSDAAVRISQSITGMVAGTEYELSAWVKIVSVGTKGIGTKMEFKNAANEYLKIGTDSTYYTQTTKDWEKITFKFTAPEDVSKAVVYLRVWDSAEVYWDDVRLVPVSESKPADKPSTEVTVGPGQLNFISNGNMDTVDSSGVPVGWKVAGLTDASSHFSVTGRDGSGKALGIKDTTNGSGARVNQTMKGLVGGQEYTFTFWMKVVSANGKGAGTKLEFKNAESNYVKLDQEGLELVQIADATNQWQKYEYKFKAPEGVDKTTVFLRLWNAGEVYFDDVSLIGPVALEKQTCEIKEPVAGAPNLIKNGDFSSLDEDGIPAGWTVVGGPTGSSWGKKISIATEEGKGNIVKIDAADSTNPWIMQTINGVLPGTEYQISGDLKTGLVAGDGPTFKVEFYSSADSKYYEEGLGNFFKQTGYQWNRVAERFTVPKGADQMKVYVRVYGAGEVYYDNIDCYKTKETAHLIDFKTQVYYYSEWDYGIASAGFNTAAYQANAGDVIEFKLMDGNTVLDSAYLPPSDEAVFKFNPMLMKEKARPYTISASYIDAGGNVLYTISEEVYRYDRPTHLNEDGMFIKHDGTVMVPTYGYHVRMEDFDECVAAGINLVQSEHSSYTTAVSRNIPYLIEYLDEAQKHDIMVLVVMYVGGNAGSEAQIPYTKACVEAVKDHPAVFGYMVMDEPFGKYQPIEEVYQMLKDAYKTIRDIDPDHVVWINENKPQQFWRSGNCSDILSHDPYPKNKYSPYEFVYDRQSYAKEAVYDQKPVYSLLQAYDYGNYMATANDIRHMSYQALIAGNEGVGYYDVADFKNNHEHIWERFDMYDGIICWKEQEVDDAYKAFVTGEYPTFREDLHNTDKQIWYKIFEKEGSLYAVILNRKKEAGSVSIPLTSIDGSISVGAFTATAADISGAPDISGNGTLDVTLTPGRVIRYKITPTAPTDFSGLTKSKLNDINTYDWAKVQIDTLYNEGIINSTAIRTYSPETKITRADFAVFLVRTLGLTAEATENFADVNPDAYYAKELAIGKAVGILKGVGNDMYEPEAEISRQDLMVICARGMRLVKELETADTETYLAGFSDNANVADYAVEDVAAMIKASIIKGNANGTINPTGNATRAEAAVIMSRILTWSK